MKKIFLLLLAFMMMFTTVSLAQQPEISIVYAGETYDIVAERFSIAAPHGTVYGYRNYGVLDKEGNMIVEPKYSSIDFHKDGRAAFSTGNGNVGFFDENWNVVIEPKYFTNGPAVYFSEGLAAVGKKDFNNKYIAWGYIDTQGNEVTDFIYDHVEPFFNAEARVGIDEYVFGGFNTKVKWGKIDKEGNILTPFKFGYATGSDYEYFWKEPIEVLLTENLVELNGKLYKNSDLEYPFINYFGYSYMPLTYYGARMLGINCDWTMEDGVMLTPGGVPSEDIIGFNGMTEGVYDQASFYKGKLSINGKVYEYGDTAYPLIHYRDVVYMPVNWENGMKELGINYTFTGPEKLENSDRGIMKFTTD